MIKFWGEGKSWSVDTIGMYSDSTPFIKAPDFEGIRFWARGVTIKADTITELFAGLAFVKSVNDQSAKYGGPGIETLVLPYIPGARQDRVNPTGDVLSSLGMVGNMINSLDFSRVLCADPHSPAAFKYINNLHEYALGLIYDHLWKGYTGVIAPDKGAKGRALHAAVVMDKPIVYGSKVRDVSNGRLTGFSIEGLVEGGHYIVVDDICDGGGTFVGLGDKIRESGAYADLFVTHGIFAKGTDDLLKYYKNIYTTDTREVHDRNKVSKFSIVEDMEQIYND